MLLRNQIFDISGKKLATILSLFISTGIMELKNEARGEQAKRLSLPTYIGTYTNKGSKGIYSCTLDLSTGQLTKTGSTEGIKDPSFLAMHPNGKVLYAVSEVSKTDGQIGGAVWSFSIDAKSGALKAMNHQLSGGEGPCYVTVDKTGQCLLVANYNNGSVSSFPLSSDGSIGKAKSIIQHKGSSIDPKRQEGPHAHSIIFSPDSKWALAADLGLDKILTYKVDLKSGEIKKTDDDKLAFSATVQGGGPRHLAFHPNGRFAYLSNEMKSSVTAMSFDAKNGTLTQIQTISNLPDEIAKPESDKNSTAEIQVHPSGKFVYCSNRGHDSIAIFAVDAQSGKLSSLGTQKTSGKTPRNFCIDPSGNFLVVCNQGSDNVATFKIDTETGRLSPVGTPVEITAPVCVKFGPQK